MSEILEFDEYSNLPPGVHFCGWEEFEERFGTTAKRLSLISGLELAMTQLKAAGCRTVCLRFLEKQGVGLGLDRSWTRGKVKLLL